MRAQTNRVNRCARSLGFVKKSADILPSSITAKLLELGYAEDEFPDSEQDPTWHKLVNQPKELTDRSTYISFKPLMTPPARTVIHHGAQFGLTSDQNSRHKSWSSASGGLWMSA